MAEIRSEQAYDAIVEEVVSRIQNLSTSEEEDFVKLQKQSEEFVKAVEFFGTTSSENAALDSLSALAKTDAGRQKLRNNIQIIRLQYKLLAAYAEALDKFFKRTTVTLQIKTGSPMTLTSKTFEQVVYVQDEAEMMANLTLSGNLPNRQKVLDEKTRQELNLKKLENNFTAVTPVYAESLRRWEWGGSRFIMWKEKKRTAIDAYKDSKGRAWGVGKVTNRGDIAEGYAGALVKEPKYMHRTKNEEVKIKNFFIYYISKVDSMAAILGADIQGENGLEYAIKATGNARPPTLSQYYKVAKNIILEEKNLIQKSLAEKIKKKYPTYKGTQRNRVQLQDEIDNIAQEGMESAIAGIDGGGRASGKMRKNQRKRFKT